MRNLNIIFCLRADFAEKPGGDVIQMQSWIKSLQALGNRVMICSGAVKAAELRGADAVFVWHLERLHESFQPWKVARQLNIPVFLVPTCWDSNPAGMVRSVKEQGKIWARWLYRGQKDTLHSMLFRSWGTCRNALLKHSSLLLVNSEAERRMLLDDGAEEARLEVIPNVIDTELVESILVTPWEKREGVICVGHFCPRKNQLGLIRALSGRDIKITFVGSARPMHKKYFRQCVDEAMGQHEFAGALAHRETLELMAQSRLAICCSFVETPGICNLEAAALGCSLVLPDIAPVREYFREMATYIRPDGINADRIIATYRTPPPAELKKSIMSNYTLKNVENIFIKLGSSEALCVKPS